MLQRSGFHGSIMIEMAGRGDLHEVLNSARQARQFLRRLAWRM